MSIPIGEIINQYTQAIISGDIPTPQVCPCCFNRPETFKLHECRKRYFHYIIENSVKVTMSLLPRWKCPDCKKTFTDYPPFASPYKRYVLFDIKRLSKIYIENNCKSYRSIVNYNGFPIGYHEKNYEYVDRFLAPTTPFRWRHWIDSIQTHKY